MHQSRLDGPALPILATHPIPPSVIQQYRGLYRNGSAGHIHNNQVEPAVSSSDPAMSDLSTLKETRTAAPTESCRLAPRVERRGARVLLTPAIARPFRLLCSTSRLPQRYVPECLVEFTRQANNGPISVGPGGGTRTAGDRSAHVQERKGMEVGGAQLLHSAAVTCRMPGRTRGPDPSTGFLELSSIHTRSVRRPHSLDCWS